MAKEWLLSEPKRHGEAKIIRNMNLRFAHVEVYIERIVQRERGGRRERNREEEGERSNKRIEDEERRRQ